VLDGLISLQDEEGEAGDLIMGQYAIVSQNEKVMVNDDALPVAGLLSEEEQRLFNKLQAPKKDDSLVWPWLLGGALLGL